MDVIFVTRFSYFGKSGWKSSASKNPDELFAPERLESRFEMFEKITLQSLADQTDGDFHHMVISSLLMPEEYQKRLTGLCHDYLGDRAHVLFRKPKHVGTIMYYYTKETWGDKEWVAQSVLDDDDAVSTDFVEACRFEAETIVNTPYSNDELSYLSFPRGFTLGLREDDERPWLATRFVPWTNLGLTVIKPPDHKKNLFNISHLKVGARYGARVASANRPFYLRTVHDHNDSRARHGKDVLEMDKIEEQYRYFPLLRNFFDTSGAMKIAAAE